MESDHIEQSNSLTYISPPPGWEHIKCRGVTNSSFLGCVCMQWVPFPMLSLFSLPLTIVTPPIHVRKRLGQHTCTEPTPKHVKPSSWTDGPGFQAMDSAKLQVHMIGQTVLLI